MTTFAKMFRQGREEAAMTLSELSRRLGVSVSHLCDIENDRRTMQLDRVVEAAKLFRVDERKLLHAAMEVAHERFGRVQLRLDLGNEAQRAVLADFIVNWGAIDARHFVPQLRLVGEEQD